jgi:stringent starvation protein B
MSKSDDHAAQGTSTRPYLIRALHDWCTDNGFTAYLAVFVDGAVQVPMEYVKNNEIVLNVSFDATSQLQLGNAFIEFQARFGGVARNIVVPIDHVIAIYARENGQGMSFPMPSLATDENVADDGSEVVLPQPSPEQSHGGHLSLAAEPSDRDRTSLADILVAVDMPDDEPPAGSPSAGNKGRPALRRVK